MSSPSGKINYAHYEGIHSVAAAAIFAGVYGILLPWYIFRAVRNPTYVLIILSLFCAIRVTAFVMRATLAASETAGENIGLVIGELIVYSVGFFGLLYSAYTLVLDRELLSGVVPRNPISRLTANRTIIRMCLSAAVAIGITGSTFINSTKQSDINLSKTLREVSQIIFLVVTGLLAVHTLFLIRHGVTEMRFGTQRASIGSKHGMHVLGLIIVLLLIREIYLTVEIGKVPSEGSWYPLAALTELLAVFLFSVPGLVPEKSDLLASQSHIQHPKDPEATELA